MLFSNKFINGRYMDSQLSVTCTSLFSTSQLIWTFFLMSRISSLPQLILQPQDCPSSQTNLCWINFWTSGKKGVVLQSTGTMDTDRGLFPEVCYWKLNHTCNEKSSLSSLPANMILISEAFTSCSRVISSFNLLTFHDGSTWTGMFMLELYLTNIWNLGAILRC